MTATKILKKEIDKIQPRDFETLCDGDLNIFCPILRKGAYPHEYMVSWQKFSEMPWQNKKEICGNLTMENITNGHYKHVKRVWEDFGEQN